MRIWGLFIALILWTSTPAAQDYERERRWAAEILPSLVVGDAVQLKLPAGREFLGLYAGNKTAKAALLLVHGVGVHPDYGVIGALRAEWRRHMTLNGIPGSAQVMIPAADHHYTGRENHLAIVIRDFVERLK